MLYETCARAEEILGLDVPDLDMEFRLALVVERGGDRVYVHWETPTDLPQRACGAASRSSATSSSSPASSASATSTARAPTG
jgi:hypothetical protein